MTKNYKKEVDSAEFNFEQNRYQVVFDTSMGAITVDLDPKIAPGHVKNLLGLAKAGFYDGLTFHRVVKGFVIQGGCPQGTGTGGPGYQIKAEFNPMKHTPGVISMARSNDPDSAGSQFFLCLENVPFLDGKYTAFGKADDAGIEVIQEIGKVATGSQDRPVKPVTINSAKVVEIPL